MVATCVQSFAWTDILLCNRDGKLRCASNSRTFRPRNSNPQLNPQFNVSCTTSTCFGSPRGLVSTYNTHPCYFDTVEVWGSSPHKQHWWSSKHEKPVQLTAGPLSFSLPLPSRDGNRLFALGTRLRGELLRLDTKSGQFVPYLGGISATGVAYSKDRSWLSWVMFPERTLWRSKADGSEKLQLTFPPMEANLPRWSPDGKQIVFMGREPGSGWRIYLLPAEGGGTPKRLSTGEENQTAPDWSPDGSNIVYGGFPEVMSGDAKATAVHQLDLASGQTSTVKWSEGLYCPRWSPNGRYISASTANAQELVVFDTVSQTWTPITELAGSCALWSHDGSYLYFQTYDVPDPAVYRVRLADRKRERLVDIRLQRTVAGAEFEAWNGLSPADEPLLLKDQNTQEIYALEWKLP
jgi:Tol biopolymer transport system component